tara:strand:+ start:385 stop:597 length:213 start_codon:yes stop_codon:yes gene_type:complete
MIRVISKDLIEINPGEVVEEITVVETILWMKFQRTYRKVHGNVFRYNKHGYKATSWTESEIEDYFNIPIE